MKNFYHEFIHLSPAKSLDEKPQDRDAAIAIFRRELTALGNDVKGIVALIDAAKSYINRHKNPRLDKRLGIHNTNSWKRCLREARVQVYKNLRSCVDNYDPLVTDEILMELRHHSLFATHRNNFVITGAFRHTKSQLQLDELRWEIYYR